MLQYLHRLHPLLPRTLPLLPASLLLHHRSSVLRSESLPRVLLHIHNRHGFQDLLPLPARSLPVPDLRYLRYLRRLHPLLPRSLPLLPAFLLLHHRSSALHSLSVLLALLLSIHSHLLLHMHLFQLSVCSSQEYIL